MNKIYIVFEQASLMTWTAVKAFKNEDDAKKYCDEQNTKNNPEFDDWGYTEGIYHLYTDMELE